MGNFVPPINYFQNTIIVSQILQRAYRMAGGLLLAGRGLNPSEQQEGLDVLNALIDGLKIEALVVEYERRTVQTLTANQQSYSVGPGQEFDLERPEFIGRAGFVVASPPPDSPAEVPMRVIATYEEWAQYVVKYTTSQIPLAIYYQASVPVGTARFWPVPSVTGQQVAIYTRQMLSEFATVDDQVNVRDGYREMLEYNLAVAIHQMPPYNKQPMDPSVTMMAENWKDRVKIAAFTPMPVASDGGARQGQSKEQNIAGFPKLWTPY